MLEKLKELFIILTITVILFVILNFGAGLIVKNRYIAVDPSESEEAIGYFKPNQEKIIMFPGLDEYRVKINNLGFRSVGHYDDMSLQEIDNKFKILAIGDSNTFGLFVDDEVSYPYKLQNMIVRDGKNAVVLNAGVGGGTINDYHWYIKNKISYIEPDVVILNFSSNDLDEMAAGKEPLFKRLVKESNKSLSQIIKITKIMRVFRPMQLNYRYKRSINKIQDERVRRILFQKSTKLEDLIYERTYRDSRIEIDPFHEELNQKWEQYFHYLDDINQILKERDIELICFLYPDITTLFSEKKDYHDLIMQRLNIMDIKYIDIKALYKRNREKYLEIYNSPPRDYHPADLGAQMIAEEVYQAIDFQKKREQ